MTILEIYLALLLIPTTAILLWERALHLFDIRSWNAYRITGLIGTPVHELSHVIACMAFRMPITKVILFSPNPLTGQLGEVQFRYMGGSLLHMLGRLVQAVAPLITGSVMMMLLFDINTHLHAGSLQSDIGPWLGAVIHETLSQSYEMLVRPELIVKLVLITCVAMHAIPSSADVFIGIRALFAMALIAGLLFLCWEGFSAILSRYSPSLIAEARSQPGSIFVRAAVEWVQSTYALIKGLLLWCVAGATSVLTLSLTANLLLVVLPAICKKVWSRFRSPSAAPISDELK